MFLLALSGYRFGYIHGLQFKFIRFREQQKKQKEL